MANQRKSRIGIKITNNISKIPFLMFADECIIFCKANQTVAKNGKCIDYYCSVSGQLVNYQKSCIQFTNGVSYTDKHNISHILMIPESNKLTGILDAQI